MSKSVVDGSFVRAEFYVQPPQAGSSPEAWEKWLAEDRKKAIAAKRAHTMSLKQEEIPEFLQPKMVSKVGGVYRQSNMVGFVGEEGSAQVEPAVEAAQEKLMALAKFNHGGRGSSGSQRASGAQRRKARRNKRRMH
jgi:hypothetical protein